MWVKQWLHYVKWYYTVAVAPGVTIQDLLDAPFVNRKWQMELTYHKLVRFGLVWKVFDMVALRGLDPRVPILGPSASYPVALYGGVSGQSFMLISTEVIHPRARKGCVVIYLSTAPWSVGCKNQGVPSRQCYAGFELFPRCLNAPLPSRGLALFLVI